MPTPDRQALLRTIEALEGQRSTLGDSMVDLAIAPLRARLAEGGAQSTASAAERRAERKVVTVMFADVAGFTAMSERIGSEETRDIVNSLFDHLVPVIERYGGLVDKFIGDEIMAVFGAPRTLERHAEHALRAGLALFAALDDFNRARGLSLGLHAGVNTGEVVAGEVGSTGRRDYSITGDTVNVAARLEAAARSGEIIVGPTTYRHALQWFEFEALQPLSLKGKSHPIAAYRLLGPAARPGGVRAEGLQLPFSGRENELAALLGFATRTPHPGGAVFVRAKPGLGKSRLLLELRERVAAQVRWLEASGQDYRTDLSYGVVSDMLDGIVGVPDGSDRVDVSRAYRDYVDGIAAERTQQALPFLLRLRGLTLAEDEESRLSALGADALRERMAAAVRDLLVAETAGQSTIVCVEDVHWADPSSVLLLRALAGDDALSHVLFVLTTRPDASPASPWIEALAATAEPCRIVDLVPLSEQDSRALLARTFAEQDAAELAEKIGAKAQGNPLYLASFLRSLIDSGLATLSNGRMTVDQPLATLAIPDTLQAVVGSQIDRLPALAKDVLHWAAILGNAFARRELEEMAREQGVTQGVQEMLPVLLDRQLIEAEAEDRLRFVHALVRDVGYDQMLERERRRLHHIAASIAERQMASAAVSEADVGLLAWHLERAGEHPAASLRYEEAGTLAASSHAHPEELLYLESAIRLSRDDDRARLDQLNERAGDALQLLGRYADAEARYRALLARETLGAVDTARVYRKIARTLTPRFAAEPVNTAIEEARRWVARAENRGVDAWRREHFAIELFAMYAMYMQGRTEDCAQFAASVADEIEAEGTLDERALFHRNVGLLRLRQERYRPAPATLELVVLANEELRQSGSVNELCLMEFGIPFAQLWSGAIDEAERGLRKVLEDTVRLGDAERNLLCLVYLAIAVRQRGDVDSAEAFATAAIARARENRSPHYEAVSHGTLAWAAWRRGDGIRADQLVELAQKATIPVYPFAWIFAAVGLARSVERRDDESAKAMIARMLEPSQQRLDDDVHATLVTARETPSRAALQAAVDACLRIRYL